MIPDRLVALWCGEHGRAGVGGVAGASTPAAVVALLRRCCHRLGDSQG
ncbi:MAG: hypothetical protein K6U89_03460 [Chloroflexi bacterium]|nr:hypothetical protein [Chloroflexota bacterium]